jgi:hypothetical protein
VPSPSGWLAEGIESNQVMTDYPEANGGGPALLSRIDRDVLDLPGLSAVVLDEGLEDVLNGRTSTDLTANGLTTLMSYVQNSGYTFVGMGLTPCLGYAGDGANPNDTCTNSVDDQRIATNTWLSGGAQANPNQFYVDPDSAVGVPDSSGTRSMLNSAADGGDHVNLTDAGFGALASGFLGAQDTWKLDDGANATDPTVALDSARSGTNPFLQANGDVGAHEATLAGTATWTSDSTVGEALSLDGMSGYAASDAAALDTTKSFSVSTWVDPSSLPSNNAAVLAQDGQHSSAFLLFYNASSKSWNFAVSPTDTPTVNLPCAIGPDPAVANTWTHIVGVYNAATKTEQLYVNGTPASQVSNVTSFGAGGSFSIGRYRWNDANAGFFPGKISDAQAWNYALTPTQVSALYKRIN